MFLFYTILFYFIPICVGGGLSNICFLHMSSMFKVRNKVSSISAVLKIKFQIMMSYTRCLNGQRLKTKTFILQRTGGYEKNFDFNLRIFSIHIFIQIKQA